MRESRWKVISSAILSLIILILAYANREWIVDALGLVRTANPFGLLVALVLILVSFLISSQVFRVVLEVLGYHTDITRNWATALVAIVISQSVPAGGIGSYAFVVNAFSRRGVSSAQATLLASLETLSYASAMILIFLFSLIYLTGRHLLTAFGEVQLIEFLLAALAAIVVIGSAVFVLTRPEATLIRWLERVHSRVNTTLRLRLDNAWIQRSVADLSHSRTVIANRPGGVVLLVLIQLTALCGHSLALLIILASLGVHTTFAVVLTAFGIALITSTFNVLPGGGGTVETALVAVLSHLGVGAAAVAATVIFRLMNYWLMLPVAFGCYTWLMHEAPVRLKLRRRRRKPEFPAN